MLEGLQISQNLTWRFKILRNFSSIYQTRKTENSRQFMETSAEPILGIPFYFLSLIIF
jgi:hypothetical protein